jgi:hypothetical protein
VRLLASACLRMASLPLIEACNVLPSLLSGFSSHLASPLSLPPPSGLHAETHLFGPIPTNPSSQDINKLPETNNPGIVES